MLKLFLMLIIVILPTMDCFLLKKKRQFYNRPHIFEKNVFSLFEFSFTWVVFLFGGRGWAWQEDCHKRMVTEACAVSPGEGGPSLTVSFLGFINGFLPHLAVNLRPKEFIGPPNAVMQHDWWNVAGTTQYLVFWKPHWNEPSWPES